MKVIVAFLAYRCQYLCFRRFRLRRGAGGVNRPGAWDHIYRGELQLLGCMRKPTSEGRTFRT